MNHEVRLPIAITRRKPFNFLQSKISQACLIQAADQHCIDQATF